MIQYEIQKTTTVYPFIDSIPFPTGLIKQLKIALKDTFQTPYISSISSASGYFSLQLQTKSSYIGNFLYNGNKWITLNNSYVFGFVELSGEPTQTFSYSGKWRLDRNCYTFPIELDGMKNFSAQGLSIDKDSTVKLSVAGDLYIRQTQESDSSQVNIGRDKDPHKDYTEEILDYSTYIKAVNKISANHLNLISSDSSIIVQAPIQKTEDIYIMYIDTSEEFPICKQWIDSDSLSVVSFRNSD